MSSPESFTSDLMNAITESEIDCECPNCGTLCKDDGITVDFTTDNMVVSLQNFSTTEWHCDSCGIDFGTCEVENIIEEF